MISDQDVIELYRCLLGRAPENADTIKAFQHYYPDFARGRQAIFRSDEFDNFLAEVAGRRPPPEDIAAGLALSLLERVGSAAAPPQRQHAPEAAIRAGLATVLERLASPLLALVVGEPSAMMLDDLLPAGPDAAVLQAAPGFPPAVPLVSRLPGGGTLFRLACEAIGLAGFLAEHNWRIGALLLVERPATAAWVDALRGRFADHALVVVGRETPDLDALTISAEIAGRHPGEPVLDWSGLRLHCYGGWHMPVSYAPPASVAKWRSASKRPRLALAAIMRDEAACIVNMLRSVQPIVSFVALLDTGSTDNTPELAEDFLSASGTEHVIETRDREQFQDRFGDMRNAALAMVPASIDWVLMLDGDEELVPEDFPKIFALMAQPDCDAYALPRYNFAGHDKSGDVMTYPDRQIRLLRNTPDRRVLYSGAVHETVRDVATGAPPLDASAIGGERGGPHIHHLVRRFRDAAQEERKQQFYRAIAERHGG